MPSLDNWQKSFFLRKVSQHQHHWTTLYRKVPNSSHQKRMKQKRKKENARHKAKLLLSSSYFNCKVIYFFQRTVCEETIQYMCSMRKKYSTCALWRANTVHVLYEEQIQYMCSMKRKYSTCALWRENTVHVLYEEKIQYMCSMKRKYSTWSSHTKYFTVSWLK
jgi:hypothetical protein